MATEVPFCTQGSLQIKNVMSARAAVGAAAGCCKWWRCGGCAPNQANMIVICAQLWALLRMMALWGVRSKPGRVSNLTSEALCRIYLGFSLGLLQPLFLLLALLLCQSSLR